MSARQPIAAPLPTGVLASGMERQLSSRPLRAVQHRPSEENAIARSRVGNNLWRRIDFQALNFSAEPSVPPLLPKLPGPMALARLSYEMNFVNASERSETYESSIALKTHLGEKRIYLSMLGAGFA